ncbi:hypothetical protein BJV78DRAFT_1155160 [Lactifluus subvellereus]|nr:hypothetical protein BJV78DRAFT_1155160 [Lactifluus subvellereus]
MFKAEMEVEEDLSSVSEKGRNAGRASAGKGVESWKSVNVYMDEWLRDGTRTDKWDNQREVEELNGRGWTVNAERNVESREGTVTFTCTDYTRKRRDTVVPQIADCERQSRVELPEDARCASQEHKAREQGAGMYAGDSIWGRVTTGRKNVADMMTNALSAQTLIPDRAAAYRTVANTLRSEISFFPRTTGVLGLRGEKVSYRSGDGTLSLGAYTTPSYAEARNEQLLGGCGCDLRWPPNRGGGGRVAGALEVPGRILMSTLDVRGMGIWTGGGTYLCGSTNEFLESSGLRSKLADTKPDLKPFAAFCTSCRLGTTCAMAGAGVSRSVYGRFGPETVRLIWSCTIAWKQGA